jgi:hypothetical protein
MLNLPEPDNKNKNWIVPYQNKHKKLIKTNIFLFLKKTFLSIVIIISISSLSVSLYWGYQNVFLPKKNLAMAEESLNQSERIYFALDNLYTNIDTLSESGKDLKSLGAWKVYLKSLETLEQRSENILKEIENWNPTNNVLQNSISQNENNLKIEFLSFFEEIKKYVNYMSCVGEQFTELNLRNLSLNQRQSALSNDPKVEEIMSLYELLFTTYSDNLNSVSEITNCVVSFYGSDFLTNNFFSILEGSIKKFDKIKVISAEIIKSLNEKNFAAYESLLGQLKEESKFQDTILSETSLDLLVKNPFVNLKLIHSSFKNLFTELNLELVKLKEDQPINKIKIF